MRIGRSISILAVLGLVGCGNAYESVSVGDWQEVGTAQPPDDGAEPRGVLLVDRISEGHGKAVKAGDLVEIRITSKEGHFTPSHMSSVEFARTQILWLWTGREPATVTYSAFMNWGSLGSARLRKALVGRSVGDRLRARLEPTAEPRITLPLKGFTVQPAAVVQDNRDPWPEFHFGTATEVELEVMNACEAKMFRKTAGIEQFGYILNMFDSGWQTERKGDLHWSAVEAQCRETGQAVRFEIGPLYFPTRGDPSLYHWRASYSQLGEKVSYRQIIGIRLETWAVVAMVAAALAFVWRRRPRTRGK